jgi:hypothetical protein
MVEEVDDEPLFNTIETSNSEMLLNQFEKLAQKVHEKNN